MKATLSAITLLAGLFLFSCSNKTNQDKEPADTNFYSQGDQNRTAAEWEPAIGVMIVWPLSLPHKLVIELAEDTHLFTLVENEHLKKEAISWYLKWGIDTSNVSFLYAKQGVDAWWVRDWGPSMVFTSDHQVKLADGKYLYSTPLSKIQCNSALEFLYKTTEGKIIKTEQDDTATLSIARQLNMDVLDIPFINTGGNVLTDGIGSAFSTCILTRENEFHGISNEQFLNLNQQKLGFNNYHIISNFERYGIQHIDCFLKLLDEERILVIQPPKDHNLYDIYENIVNNELSTLKSPYGRPYEILRMKTERFDRDSLAAYTNALILNKTIYVPLFQIDADKEALERWKEVMPGYTIKGFEFDLESEPHISKEFKDHYKNYGWNGADGLHCRTRAVWDPEMLFISVNRIKKKVNTDEKKEVFATIIDYSKKGLVQNKCILFWRPKNQTNWNQIVLSKKDGTDHFFAEVPYQKSGDTVEYYVSAYSNSGKIETMPRTAPLGFYTFSIH